MTNSAVARLFRRLPRWNPFLAGFGILAKRQPIRPAITICLTTSARYLLLLSSRSLSGCSRAPCQRLIQDRLRCLVSRHFGPILQASSSSSSSSPSIVLSMALPPPAPLRQRERPLWFWISFAIKFLGATGHSSWKVGQQIFIVRLVYL